MIDLLNGTPSTVFLDVRIFKWHKKKRFDPLVSLLNDFSVDQLTVVLIPVIVPLCAVNTKLSWLVLCSVLLSYTDKPQ